MKTRPCCAADCGEKRLSHDRPYEPRGTRHIQVEDHYPDDSPIYCSIECACYDGAFHISNGTKWGATTKSGYKLPDEPPKEKK